MEISINELRELTFSEDKVRDIARDTIEKWSESPGDFLQGYPTNDEVEKMIDERLDSKSYVDANGDWFRRVNQMLDDWNELDRDVFSTDEDGFKSRLDSIEDESKDFSKLIDERLISRIIALESTVKAQDKTIESLLGILIANRAPGFDGLDELRSSLK